MCIRDSDEAAVADAKRKADEEAAAKAVSDAAEAKRKADEEAAAKALREAEEAATKRAADEAEAKRKADEEAAAKASRETEEAAAKQRDMATVVVPVFNAPTTPERDVPTAKVETPDLTRTSRPADAPVETPPGTTPIVEAKPAETPKAEETKPAETPKAEETKPAETPKVEETAKAEESKPAETPKATEKKGDAKAGKTPAPKSVALTAKRRRGKDLVSDLFDALMDLSFATSAEDACSFAARVIREHVSADACTVSLYDIDRDDFVVTAAEGIEANGARHRAKGGHRGAAARKHAALNVKELDGVEAFEAHFVGAPALYAPSYHRDRLFAMVVVQRYKGGPAFETDEEDGVTYVAAQLGEALSTHSRRTAAADFAEVPAPGGAAAPRTSKAPPKR